MQQSVTHKRLTARYDRLWSAAIGRISAGRPDLDPILRARWPDRRRGLTVIARPSADCRQRVTEFLQELRSIEPDQHYYAPSEIHLTILALFTATVNHESFFARRQEYVAAASSALRGVSPIRIEFRGVTASPGTVMIQGFSETGALNDLREALRRRLRLRGLIEGLDQRYRLETAHMTVVRFRTRFSDSERFVATLERSRQRAFGVTRVKSVTLVKHDWYMTRQVLETVKRYRLQTAR